MKHAYFLILFLLLFQNTVLMWKWYMVIGKVIQIVPKIKILQHSNTYHFIAICWFTSRPIIPLYNQHLMSLIGVRNRFNAKP